MSTSTPARTRLAPSPTGALHLGNARTFLVNWALARQQGWKIVLRIEDLDGPRVKPESSQQAIDLLTWLGIDWDEGPIYQAQDLTPYRQACEILAQKGLVYPCTCTRRQIEAASLSAPQGAEHELRYPGTCRPSAEGISGSRETPTEPSVLRFVTHDEPTSFLDEIAGEQEFNVHHECGDFIVRTRDKQPSYQLAVVVDDVRQGITHVVRGDDLLSSTARQILLYRALDCAQIPNYIHLPLVVGEDGRRLAKRHGDSRLGHYRQIGVAPEKIIGLTAEWCGLGNRKEMSIQMFLREFELSKLPPTQIIFDHATESWLRGF